MHGHHRPRDRPRRDRADRELHRVGLRPRLLQRAAADLDQRRPRAHRERLRERRHRRGRSTSTSSTATTCTPTATGCGSTTSRATASRRSRPSAATSRFQPDDDGRLDITEDDRDGFPAYATYQYLPGESDNVIEHRDAGSPIELITPPDLPDLPNLPDLPGPLPDLPDLPEPAPAARTCRTRPTSRTCPTSLTSRTCPDRCRTCRISRTCRTCPDDAHARHPARSRRRRAARGGCGEDDEVREAPAMPDDRHHARPRGGRLPGRPQVTDDFADPGSGWPRTRLPRGRLRRVGRRDGRRARAAARRRPRPAARSPRSWSSRRAAAPACCCRASYDGAPGYALLLGADGRVQLSRIEDGKASVLKDFRLTPNERSDARQAVAAAARLRHRQARASRSR